MVEWAVVSSGTVSVCVWCVGVCDDKIFNDKQTS